MILGAGELGGAITRQLAAADIAGRIVLVDDSASVAAGKALDIQQAAPIDGYSTELSGTSDESVVVGADVLVIADRSADNREWQDDAGVALVRRMTYLNPSALLLCAGASQLSVIERGVREGGIDSRRLIGSAPEALRSAVVSLAALEGGCTPAEVSLTVLGRPPGEIIVPWGDASIGGRRADEALAPPAIARLDGRLSRLWPPGPLTLAGAATRVLAAAARRSPVALSVFAAAPRELGGRARAGMLPVHVRSHGIAAMLPPALTGRDRVRLDTALQR